MKLKICGMREGQNIKDVSSMGIDYMGFIFYPKSPRFVGEDFKMPALPDNVERIGVFVNEATGAMKDKLKTYRLNYLQLHGAESPQQCEELKRSGIGVIKVFSVDSDFSFEKTRPYQGIVDFFLFDTKGKHYGGNAAKFEWKILEAYDQSIPFFLSGGIGPADVAALTQLKGMNLHALDVNSGVELAMAMKDVQKIKLLQQNLKAFTTKTNQEMI